MVGGDEPRADEEDVADLQVAALGGGADVQPGLALAGAFGEVGVRDGVAGEGVVVL